jgi:hypothetical protein
LALACVGDNGVPSNRVEVVVGAMTHQLFGAENKKIKVLKLRDRGKKCLQIDPCLSNVEVDLNRGFDCFFPRFFFGLKADLMSSGGRSYEAV